jgi:hypothetical protein
VSKTPGTDADLARQLETELAAKDAKLDEAKKALDRIATQQGWRKSA